MTAERRRALAAALVLAATGVFLKTALVGYGFLAYCLFAAAGIIGLYMLLGARKTGAARTLRTILTCALALFLVLLAATETVIIRAGAEDAGKDASAGYAIVLGAGVNGTEPSRSLLARLEAAERYAAAYPDAVLIVSGGKGAGEDVTEAECMKSWLASRGVSPDRIIEETKAKNTRENIVDSRALILARTPDFSGRVCIITEGYHVLRAKMFAAAAGMSSVAVPGATHMPVLTVNYYLREAFAVWYYTLKGWRA